MICVENEEEMICVVHVAEIGIVGESYKVHVVRKKEES